MDVVGAGLMYVVVFKPPKVLGYESTGTQADFVPAIGVGIAYTIAVVAAVGYTASAADGVTQAIACSKHDPGAEADKLRAKQLAKEGKTAARSGQCSVTLEKEAEIRDLDAKVYRRYVAVVEECRELRKRTRTLIKEAVVASDEDHCERVVALDREIRLLDAELYATEFLRDASIKRCFAVPEEEESSPAPEADDDDGDGDEADDDDGDGDEADDDEADDEP